MLCLYNKLSQLPSIAYDLTISFQEVESEISLWGVRSKMEMSSQCDRYLHIPYQNKIFQISSVSPYCGNHIIVWNYLDLISKEIDFRNLQSMFNIYGSKNWKCNLLKVKGSASIMKGYNFLKIHPNYHSFCTHFNHIRLIWSLEWLNLRQWPHFFIKLALIQVIAH